MGHRIVPPEMVPLIRASAVKLIAPVKMEPNTLIAPVAGAVPIQPVPAMLKVLLKVAVSHHAWLNSGTLTVLPLPKGNKLPFWAWTRTPETRFATPEKPGLAALMARVKVPPSELS